MTDEFTPVIRKGSRYWIGWIEEMPGVNSQGETREELLANLASARSEMLELVRDGAPPLRPQEASSESP
ncbi:type II toxin-antitoxin system HicB family antitoxin [Longimicrobium sp.]|uniref:type II toxin-antitoxin system HicB family antitoxin n=1 Tax=Longimicrobium sp. TaxID=2029185 RepID=UPI002ED7C7EC